MSTKTLGRALVIIGIFIIVVSLAVDYIGLGDERIGASQLLGVMGGIFVLLIGIPLTSLFPDEKIDPGQRIRTGLAGILNWPVSVWVLIGVFLTYILFFIFPMFLNEDWGIYYFTRYLPDKRPIGLDFRYTMSYVTPWVEARQSPYPDLFYPPLTHILFAPFTLIGYPESYKLITFMTLFSFCGLSLLGAFLISRIRDYSLIVLFLVSGLLSYGFQFELERGQFNVVTFFLCVLSVYIFHRHYRFRYLAYALFSAAIQIKLYPAIFILMFVKDWREWKTNIKRWVGLGILNFLLLFALGYHEFLAFIDTVKVQIFTPSWSWNGNHSIQSFVFNFLRDGYGLIPPGTLTVFQQNAGLIRFILLAAVLGCIFATVVRAYRLNEHGFNTYIFSVCTLGALIIPTSNDYTLPLLAAPLAIFFSSLPQIHGFRMKWLSILLILIASFAYGSILHPFKYKPYYMNNSFPPLFIILLAVTFLYFLRNKSSNLEMVNTTAKAS